MQKKGKSFLASNEEERLGNPEIWKDDEVPENTKTATRLVGLKVFKINKRLTDVILDFRAASDWE